MHNANVSRAAGLAALVFCASPLLAAESHAALLPRPQKLSYGKGSVPLRRLRVIVPSQAGEAELFAARTLEKGLAAITGPSSDGSVPVKLIREGEDSPLPGVDDRSGPGTRESYRLKIQASGVELRSPGTAGLFYGVQTLLQLVEGAGASAVLPEATIEDWPELPYRGFMMDTAHGPLPTEEEIERQIDFLARWKVNQYYFYAETNVELKGYPLLNAGARYSHEQIRRIVAYAKERHVDVVPTFEFCGHLHDMFRLETYAGLAAIPHGGDLLPTNPEGRRILADWIGQLSALFPSPWFHMGLDEPWELEIASASQGMSPGRLYIDHLKAMAALVGQHGKRPMFWADVTTGAKIFERYPELFEELPKNTIAVPWLYDAQADFKSNTEPFEQRHVPFVVTTGVDCWDNIVPNFRGTFANIDGFVEQGKKNHALGMINSGWTDAAQVLYRTALPAMAYGGVAAWQTNPIDRTEFFKDYSLKMYAPQVAREVAPALEALAESQQLALKALGGQTIFRLWEDPLLPRHVKHYAAHTDEIHRLRLSAEQAQAHLETAKDLGGDGATLDSLYVGARMLAYAGMKAGYAIEIQASFEKLGSHPTRKDAGLWLGRQAAGRNHSAAADLMDQGGQLRELYRKAWLAEYEPYRLNTALGRWDAEYEYWRAFQQRVWEGLEGFQDGDTLPPLEYFRPRK